MRHRSLFACAFLLALAGCNSTPATPATDAGNDASHAGHDAASDDAGPTADTGTDAGSDTGPTTDTIAIHFAAVVRDMPFSCGSTYSGFGPSADQSLELTDFRFYVHGIELIDDTGATVPFTMDSDGVFQDGTVALLDFEDATAGCTEGTAQTHEAVTGTIPTGHTLEGLRFVLGVPFAENHQDASAAAAPLNFTGMFWDWQYGYKFLRIDALGPSSGGARPAFFVHLGSTGCDGTPAGGVTMCAQPNLPTIELHGVDAATDIVQADFAALVGTMDLYTNTPMTAPGCMSEVGDPECVPVFPALGLALPSHPAAQAFFSVAP